MGQSTKRNLLIGGSLLVVAGIGGYFLFKYLKKKREEEAKKKSDAAAAAEASKAAESKPVATKPIPQEIATVGSNPFKSSAEVKKFQNWVVSVKNDSKILGSSGADGKWGKNTSAAYSKYGNEYQATLTAKASFNGMTVICKDSRF